MKLFQQRRIISILTFFSISNTATTTLVVGTREMISSSNFPQANSANSFMKNEWRTVRRGSVVLETNRMDLNGTAAYLSFGTRSSLAHPVGIETDYTWLTGYYKHLDTHFQWWSEDGRYPSYGRNHIYYSTPQWVSLFPFWWWRTRWGALKWELTYKYMGNRWI